MPTEIQTVLQTLEQQLTRPVTFDELRVVLLELAESHLREGRREPASQARAAYRALMNGALPKTIVWAEAPLA